MPRFGSRTTLVCQIGGVASGTMHLVEKRGAEPIDSRWLICFLAGATAACMTAARDDAITHDRAKRAVRDSASGKSMAKLAEWPRTESVWKPLLAARTRAAPVRH